MPLVELAGVCYLFLFFAQCLLLFCGNITSGVQLRRLWCEGQHIPGIPADEIPDLNCCLLYQQLQVINCCISRKHRRAVATESLDSVLKQANSNGETASESSLMYARISSGQLVLRLGAAELCENLTLLETGEPVYAPVMQV